MKERLGGLHSAKVVLHSVDFHEIEALQHAGDWDAAGRSHGRAARSGPGRGADFLVLCTNTMHKVADAMERRGADPPAAHRRPHRGGGAATGASGRWACWAPASPWRRPSTGAGCRAARAGGARARAPGTGPSSHRIIYEELCLGRVLDASRAEFHRIIQGLAAAGAEGIILGCTEIGLLIRPSDVELPTFATTRLHAAAAVKFALS